MFQVLISYTRRLERAFMKLYQTKDMGSIFMKGRVSLCITCHCSMCHADLHIKYVIYVFANKRRFLARAMKKDSLQFVTAAGCNLINLHKRKFKTLLEDFKEFKS